MPTFELPNTPATFFIMGPLMEAFCGFWTAGAHGARVAAQEDLDTLAKGAAPAKAVVYTSYREGGNTYDTTYNFKVPTGQAYDGEYRADQKMQEGQTIPVLYAKADPTISHPTFKPLSLDASAPMELIGVAFGTLLVVLMAFLGLKSTGVSRTAVTFFILLCCSFFVLGMPFGGLINSGERYTVQVGDNAWSSSSFGSWHPDGVDFKIDNDVLVYSGRSYPLPHRAHIWFKDGQVLINGATR